MIMLLRSTSGYTSWENSFHPAGERLMRKPFGGT
jgi:hypothetical protein